jgi:hypothetical protein
LRTLPPKMVQVLTPFAPLFSKRVWQHAQLLLMGAILATGRSTVSSALRAMGLDHEKRFHRYHRVLSSARWSGLEASRVLLGLLLEAFRGVRRREGAAHPRPRRDAGATLGQEDLRKGRLPRSGAFHPRGVRQKQRPQMGLRDAVGGGPLGFSGAGPAFPLGFSPSERYAAERGRRHKKITEWAWQLLLVLRRWYPKRQIVAVADRAYAPRSNCSTVAAGSPIRSSSSPLTLGCCPLRTGPATTPPSAPIR